MEDFIDFDTSSSLRHEKTIEQLGEELLDLVIEVASGRQVKHEILGISELAMPRLCNYC